MLCDSDTARTCIFNAHNILTLIEKRLSYFQDNESCFHTLNTFKGFETVSSHVNEKCDIISKIYKQIISTGNVNKDSTCIRSVGVKEWNSGSQIVEQWESKCGTVGVKEWNSRSQRVEQWESKSGTVGFK